METKTVSLLPGVKRNSPLSSSNQGLDTCVNWRNREGALRPIGNKKLMYPTPPYNKFWIHENENYTNWIGFDEANNKLVQYNPQNQVVVAEIKTFVATESIQRLETLKNIVIVLTDIRVYYFLYNGNSYVDIDPRIGLSVIVTSTGNELQTTENASDYEGVIGKLYKKIREINDDDNGLLSGGLFWRAAVKLFDGSLILHTVPKYQEMFNMDMSLQSIGGGQYNVQFNSGYIKATFSSAFYANYAHLTDIISSISIYATPVKHLYDFEDTITEDNLTLGSNNFSVIGEISDDYKKLYDNSFYLLGEIPFSDLTSGLRSELTLDCKGFYSDYATREAMKIDNFTHHYISAQTSKVYNDRLMMGDIKQIFHIPSDMLAASPAGGLLDDTWIQGALNVNFKIHTHINTSLGEKIIVSAGVFYEYTNNGNKYILVPGIFGYPDARAKQVKIYYKDTPTTWRHVISFNLQEHITGNFAFSCE